MKVHKVKTSVRVPLQIDEVFPFFYDVLNLQRITPPELDFGIVTPQPINIELGTIVDYRMKLFSIPFKWRSVISTWDPPHKFVDEQVSGPYRLWKHTHNFYTDGDGTIIEDDVSYRLPLWPLGEIAYPLVKAQLRRIFSYRQRRIVELLAEAYVVESSDQGGL
jgi:ligand-binding SRPBCC domain-containing protein